jgi:sec-independent protein translocase protein TatA
MPGFGSLGGTELIIALVIILLLFGAKRIPELAKGLGSGVREFRKGTRGEGEVEEEEKDAKGEELTAGTDKAEETRAGDEARAEGDKAEQKPS